MILRLDNARSAVLPIITCAFSTLKSACGNLLTISYCLVRTVNTILMVFDVRSVCPVSMETLQLENRQTVKHAHAL